MTLLTAVAGAMVGAAARAYRDRLTSRPQDRTDLTPVEDCEVAIVLVGRDDKDPVSRAIDDMTGRRGFSHVLLDACRVDEHGRRVAVDYTVRHGVHWSTLDQYRHRRIVSIPLPFPIGLEVWGCVRAQLGRPMDVAAIALGIDTRASCVGLIVACLPWSMQEDLLALRRGPCVSPNTLAEYWGIG